MIALAAAALVAAACSRPVFPHCAKDEECGPGSTCQDTNCILLGEGKCRLPEACKQPENATATCVEQACGFTCNAGYHAAEQACGADTSECCGPECTNCGPAIRRMS